MYFTLFIVNKGYMLFINKICFSQIKVRKNRRIDYPETRATFDTRYRTKTNKTNNIKHKK